jgi:hypothetical protein
VIKRVEVDEKTIMLLAAEAQVDRRTAKRALIEGIEAVRGWVVKERLRTAAKKIGLNLV